MISVLFLCLCSYLFFVSVKGSDGAYLMHHATKNVGVIKILAPKKKYAVSLFFIDSDMTLSLCLFLCYAFNVLTIEMEHLLI